jgi:hypothetical protein
MPAVGGQRSRQTPASYGQIAQGCGDRRLVNGLLSTRNFDCQA